MRLNVLVLVGHALEPLSHPLVDRSTRTPGSVRLNDGGAAASFGISMVGKSPIILRARRSAKNRGERLDCLPFFPVRNRSFRMLTEVIDRERGCDLLISRLSACSFSKTSSVQPSVFQVFTEMSCERKKVFWTNGNHRIYETKMGY